MPDVKVTKDLDNNTLTIECTFDAPKQKLWDAYTIKDLYEKWWGPQGWQTTTKEFDFKQGGRVHYCMKCVDENQSEWFGQEAWGMTTIQDIDQLNSYKARDFFSDAEGNINTDLPGMLLFVEFKETNGKTTVYNRTITESPEQLEQLIKMGMIDGFSSQLNRLEQLIKD